MLRVYPRSQNHANHPPGISGVSGATYARAWLTLRQELSDNGYQMRAELSLDVHPVRTYTTKHGTEATINTANIGQRVNGTDASTHAKDALAAAAICQPLTDRATYARAG